jgi:hypothetical protein
MDITCSRCHQTVQADNCYCPNCGMPQLVYAAEGTPGLAQPEMLHGIVRDASMVDWKAALRSVLLLGVPAGFLSSGVSPLWLFSLFWMAGAASLAVTLYMRNQRPAWITMGAGARIGLVTGLLSGWIALAVGGSWLFFERFVLHHDAQLESSYKTYVTDVFQQGSQQALAGMAASDAAKVQPVYAQIQNWIVSPEGHAGMWTLAFAINSIFLLLFAIGGGVLGARMVGRRRQPEV